MPEYRECVAHYLLLIWWYQHWMRSTPLSLLALWADASKVEESAVMGAQDGHVYKLDATSRVARGTCNSQTYLWPPMWMKTEKNPNPPPIQSLSLKNITMTGRAVILDLGRLFLKFSYLTHTSVQIYRRRVWYTSVRGVDKSQRGFHVGLALEFEEFVIGFISNDMVFQPIWRTSQAKLPPSPPDVYDNYSSFLENVVKWIQGRLSKPRSGLACEVIRDANDVWSGIGVYTVCEVFFDAGLSPFLTEAEVFDSPSRTARLCEAFWSFAHYSYTHLPKLMKPCLVDGLLAPTKEQRLRYKDWLHVYAKDLVRMPGRLAKLVDDHQTQLHNLGRIDQAWYRNAEQLYDVFEPAYIADALNRKSPPPLGVLIFGEKLWAHLSGITDIPNDPLTSYFLKINQPKTSLTSYFSKTSNQEPKTFLRPGHYTTLLPHDKVKATRPTYAYQATKQVWSVTSAFPWNSYTKRGVKPVKEVEIKPIIGEKRKKKLFKTIITETCGVSIGPLEYCGNAQVVRDTHGRKLVSVVRGDPAIGARLAFREIAGLMRIKAGLDRRGRSKRAMSKAHRDKLQGLKEKLFNRRPAPHSLHHVSQLSSSLPPSSPQTDDTSIFGAGSSTTASFPTSTLPSSIPSPPPAKKRRLSQDKHLALAAADNTDLNLQPRRRTRSCTVVE